jgi:uncharacterized protein YecE (DUF72 family)
MKFGKVPNPETVDFTLPADHSETERVLKEKGVPGKKPDIYVGCAKWNRTDLKGFYPRGTKDELAYYSQQFNSIELNATFYRPYGAGQYEKWSDKTPDSFKFFPKVNQEISHWKRLKGAQEITTQITDAALALEEKLGMMFLQLRDDYKPKDAERLEGFLKGFPTNVPLAVEVRNLEWFEEPNASQLYNMLEAYNKTNIIVDTAGRRDMLHMRLTSPYAFVRYVGANIDSDYDRLDQWLDKLEPWIEQGIKGIYFFIHQNVEQASPLLAAHFIEKLNARFDYDLKIPNKGDNAEPKLL